MLVLQGREIDGGSTVFSWSWASHEQDAKSRWADISSRMVLNRERRLTRRKRKKIKIKKPVKQKDDKEGK